MYERGLAHRTLAPVDWCPKDNTSLAREQVVGENRVCERCGTPVVKKNLEQWFLNITAYADELLDFSSIEWPERVRTLQQNWIGKSVGVEFELRVKDVAGASFRVFTTRPDTVYGMTFAVLAPEHPLVDRLTAPERRAEVEAYKFKAARESDIERLSTEKERDGVFIGAYAINPMNEAPVPIFAADYVLLTYGTGAIQGVPAHDARDFAFAKKYGLPIPMVVAPPGWDGQPLDMAYLDEGTMVNSGPFTGVPSSEGWKQIAEYMETHGIGQRKAHYRLHDWLISRQRYWGTPIPIIYCPHCGTVPVPDADLPVLLPQDAEFLPTGQSPLKFHEGFRRVRCPRCGTEAERETDTMDTFVDSSWYQYRYLSPQETSRPFDLKVGSYWLPVDQYTGGMEHAVLHLMYTRFWTKVMRDLGQVMFGEPMRRLFNQGVILGEDGEKMSKSRGNVVNPDEFVQTVGADTVRAYLMFIGPWDGGGPWNSRGIDGMHRFLLRVWNVVQETGGTRSANNSAAAPRSRVPKPGRNSNSDHRELTHWTHKTIKKVTEDLEGFHFNTALAALMEFVNYLYKVRDDNAATAQWREALRAVVLLLAPMTPHITEELWGHMGESYSVHTQRWPSYDEGLARAETTTLVLQVDGKVRDRIQIPADLAVPQTRELALRNEKVRKFMGGRQVADVVVVPGRLVNVVTK
jgi:leucyl-tRNA synthetase